jgi:hypothetical protein
METLGILLLGISLMAYLDERQKRKQERKAQEAVKRVKEWWK